MITTDIDRYEYSQPGTENYKVFRSEGTDIPVKNAAHINVYVTTTGDFTADFANNELDDNAHGHANANELTFTNSGGALPTGLLTNTLYYVVNTDTNDFQVSLTSGGTPVTFTDAGTGTHTWSKVTPKVLNTDYTVSLSGTTATITWESGKRPADGEKVLFLRSVPFQQDTDLKNNSLFEAESVETQLDLIVNMTQQLKNTTARNLRFSDLLLADDAKATAATLTATATGRANKALKFDSIGNLGVSTIDVDDAQDYVLEAKSYASEAYNTNVNTYDNTVASPISNTYSALHYSTLAENSAIIANASADAVAKIHDSFDDKYLGNMASAIEFTANASTDFITSNAHGRSNGDLIRLETTNTLPAGLSASTNYYVVSKTTNTFKVEASVGGGAINITDTGTGTHYWQLYNADVTTPASSSWAKNSSVITVASNTGIRKGQVVSGSGIPTDPKPNVLNVNGTSITISDNMDSVGTSVAVTFANKGSYGLYDRAKAGPSTNNDGEALEDGMLYFNTTLDVILVYDADDTLWRQITPPAASQQNIDILTTKFDGTNSATSGDNLNIKQVDTVADAVANVNTVAGKNDEIGRLGTTAMSHASTGALTRLGTDAHTNASTGTLTRLGTDAMANASSGNLAKLGTDDMAHASTGNLKVLGDNVASLTLIGTGYDGTANTSGTNTNMTQIDVCADNIDALNTVATNAEGNAISMAIALG